MKRQKSPKDILGKIIKVGDVLVLRGDNPQTKVQVTSMWGEFVYTNNARFPKLQVDSRNVCDTERWLIVE